MPNDEITQPFTSTVPATIPVEVLLTLAVRVRDRATRGGEIAIDALIGDLEAYAPGIKARFRDLDDGN